METTVTLPETVDHVIFNVALDITVPCPNWKALTACASRDALRPAIMNVLLRVKAPGSFVFIATDGHRLYEEKMECHAGSEAPGDYYIHSSAFEQLRKMKGEVHIVISRPEPSRYVDPMDSVAKITDARGVTAHSAQETDERYPNYEAVMPEVSHNLCVYANTEEIREAYSNLKRHNALTLTEQIIFTPTYDRLPGSVCVSIVEGLHYEKTDPQYLKVKKAKKGKKADTEPVAQNLNLRGCFVLGDSPMPVGFNMRYLADIDQVTSGDYTMYMEGPSRPAQMCGHVERPRAPWSFWRFLIMPTVLITYS